MTVRTRLALFALALAGVFAAAVAVGSAFEPADTTSGDSHSEPAHAPPPEGGSHGEAGHGAGYDLRLAATSFTAGAPAELGFEVVGPDGEALTEFDETHERRMHLIVVRRDGTGFRHLHPEMSPDGTWTTPVRFASAGAHRVFADFAADGADATLAADVFVDGDAPAMRPFPAPRPSAGTDGYTVRLEAADIAAGEPATLAFAVEQDGDPVADLGEYLGAKGHLVVLREGDLAFLHVHPEDHGHGGGSGHGDPIEFETEFPTRGRYRLYLQFRHDGVVRTAELTVEVDR